MDGAHEQDMPYEIGQAFKPHIVNGCVGGRLGLHGCGVSLGSNRKAVVFDRTYSGIGFVIIIGLYRLKGKILNI